MILFDLWNIAYSQTELHEKLWSETWWRENNKRRKLIAKNKDVPMLVISYRCQKSIYAVNGGVKCLICAFCSMYTPLAIWIGIVFTCRHWRSLYEICMSKIWLPIHLREYICWVICIYANCLTWGWCVWYCLLHTPCYRTKQH